MLVETDISTSGLRSNHKGALITPLRRLLGDTGPHPPWDDSAPIRGGAVQRRTSGRTRAQPRRRAGGDGRRAEGRPTGETACRKRSGIAFSLSRYRGGRRRGAGHHPPAEWLIDNFHVVEKQIREIRADLPPGYYRQLPKLASPADRSWDIRAWSATHRRAAVDCGAPLRLTARCED